MLKPEFDTSELREKLGEQAYSIVAHGDTERAFTGKYWDTTESGVYQCIVCHTPLFSSATKFDSHCGWPSYYDAIGDTIGTRVDTLLGYPRTEIFCMTCGAHLGHVFDDGPRDRTGLRYCVNSASIHLDSSVD
jgi:peptide-methionine (R)-S-oxide reductase